MKIAKRILWGTVLILLGALWILDLCDVMAFELFFEGWWTLFIIVPCAIALVTERDKLGSLFGLLLGVGLLLAARDIITYSLFWKLFLPVCVILVGLRLIFGGLLSSKKRKASAEAAEKIREKLGKTDGSIPEYCATFSALDLNFDGQEFYGVTVSAVFGGVELDLRNAILTDDPVITISTVFGGGEILLPENVSVVVSTSSVFGSIDVADRLTRKQDESCRTVYITANTVFGGVDIE